MIIDLQPSNMDELFSRYWLKQKGSLSDLLDRAPEAKLTQTLKVHGDRLSWVYGSTWERLQEYAGAGKLQSYAKDFSRFKIVSEDNAIFPPDEEDLKKRANAPETLALEVATIEDALLMTDQRRYYRDHEDVADLLTYFMGDSDRINIFDGTVTRMDTDEHPSVWSPSIDTDLFRTALKIVIEANGTHDFTRAAEIGYASGAIARYMVDNADIGTLHLAELNGDAIPVAAEALSKTGIDPRYYIGDGLKGLLTNAKRGSLFDLVACNPPYLPRPLEGDVGNSAHFQGTDLFTGLITRADEYLAPGGRLIINVSDMALPELEYADRKARDRGIERRLLFKKRVPIKVYEFETDQGWRDWLANFKGSPIEREDGYYWQTLMFMEYKKAA